jgi:hypothetical protein
VTFARLSENAVQLMGRLPSAVIEWLGRVPTTNLRVMVSLVLAIGTGVRVLIVWTAPPWEWLAFLGAMMSLDVAQFGTKRLTDSDYVKAKQAPQTGD